MRKGKLRVTDDLIERWLQCLVSLANKFEAFQT